MIASEMISTAHLLSPLSIQRMIFETRYQIMTPTNPKPSIHPIPRKVLVSSEER
nr:MAG TPA: hypothetical protein [Caudoviricetes sp.]